MYNNFYPYYRLDNMPTGMSALELNNEMRRLWQEHGIWTKLAITALASNAPDTQLVTARLLRNGDDFAKLFSNFYDPTSSQKFGELIKEHLMIAADLVMAAKRNDTNAMNAIEKKWYANADEIANFMGSINPYWNVFEVRNMLHQHLALVKDEAVAILNHKYAEEITIFDQIGMQAMMMADMFTNGIIQQFPDKFRY